MNRRLFLQGAAIGLIVPNILSVPPMRYKAINNAGNNISTWLSPNNDIVTYGPYYSVTTDTENLNDGEQSGRFFLSVGHKNRIRQKGIISSVRCNFTNVNAITGYYVCFYRKVGSDYVLIGQSSNLASSLSVGIQTLAFSSGVSVQEGDYIGELVVGTDYGFYSLTSQTGVTMNYATLTEAPASTDLGGYTTVAGAIHVLEVSGQAPVFCSVGDSIIAGYPAHYSFLETTETTNISSTISYQLSNLLGSVSYQNMGISGQQTTAIEARFAADIVSKKPRFALLEGGINDVAGGVAFATFQTNWTSVLNQCQSVNIKPIILLILPRTNGSNANMVVRDTWNSWLDAVARSYRAVVVDASPYVGVFRAGGDSGNLWDINPAYDADGVHFNAAGHALIAQAIFDTMRRFK